MSLRNQKKYIKYGWIFVTILLVLMLPIQAKSIPQRDLDSHGLTQKIVADSSDFSQSSELERINRRVSRDLLRDKAKILSVRLFSINPSSIGDGTSEFFSGSGSGILISSETITYPADSVDSIESYNPEQSVTEPRAQDNHEDSYVDRERYTDTNPYPQNKTIYFILTNEHVLKWQDDDDKLYAVTHDGLIHPIHQHPIEFKIRGKPIDLKLLWFESAYHYSTFNPNRFESKVTDGERLYVLGYACDLSSLEQHCRSHESFLVGEGYRFPRPLKDGYQIGYNLDVVPGMSGGVVLNSVGRLVGINGRTKAGLNNDIYKTMEEPRELNRIEILEKHGGLSLAIPIEYYQREVDNQDLLKDFELSENLINRKVYVFPHSSTENQIDSHRNIEDSEADQQHYQSIFLLLILLVIAVLVLYLLCTLLLVLYNLSCKLLSKVFNFFNKNH